MALSATGENATAKKAPLNPLKMGGNFENCSEIAVNSAVLSGAENSMGESEGVGGQEEGGCVGVSGCEVPIGAGGNNLCAPTAVGGDEPDLGVKGAVLSGAENSMGGFEGVGGQDEGVCVGGQGREFPVGAGDNLCAPTGNNVKMAYLNGFSYTQSSVGGFEGVGGQDEGVCVGGYGCEYPLSTGDHKKQPALLSTGGKLAYLNGFSYTQSSVGGIEGVGGQDEGVCVGGRGREAPVGAEGSEEKKNPRMCDGSLLIERIWPSQLTEPSTISGFCGLTWGQGDNLGGQGDNIVGGQPQGDHGDSPRGTVPGGDLKREQTKMKTKTQKQREKLSSMAASDNDGGTNSGGQSGVPRGHRGTTNEGGASRGTTEAGMGTILRSALKKSGQKSRGHRVCINEARNESLEADYVILVHEESEPQLVSIRNLDLGLHSGPNSSGPSSGPTTTSSGPPELTLSPPEGYKDCFSHHIEDSDTESSGDGIGETDRSQLPDLIRSELTGGLTGALTQLTVENVRHHDQLMRSDGGDTKGKPGILKGGKYWRNGAKGDEEGPRSVRFSGRDEYSLLESLPLDAANSAALARVMPKLRELQVLLEPREARDARESREIASQNSRLDTRLSLDRDWHIELSPIEPEGGAEGNVVGLGAIEDEAPPTPPPPPPPQMDDEQIRESMQRYDEMRRRIAAAEGRESREGRDNTSICSDESKSSSDSQSSDSTMTETRIRRLENTDVAQVAGGVMRSNSEVRRAIERNALRRSLIRFSEARKKDTNKNDKSEKGETSLLEKLKWLTASEDATNGNEEKRDEVVVDSKVQDTIAQYRKLAEMFNRTTAMRASDIMVPGDVREWKLKADLFPPPPEETEESEAVSTLPPHPSTLTSAPSATPIHIDLEDDTEKLIYSGGVRYTREGTLPPAGEGEESDAGHPSHTPTTTAEARKQFLAQMQTSVPSITLQNGDRSSLVSSDSYTFEDIDEALGSGSVTGSGSTSVTSSQSSPRIKEESTNESGYSSNETNGELQCPLNGLPLTAASLHQLPFNLPNVDIDELAEFVRNDAERLERLRRRYDSEEDHGFSRRPSVRGIKNRFGSTIDLLKQMATQLAPQGSGQQSGGSHNTWPYRELEEEPVQSGAPSGGPSGGPSGAQRSRRPRSTALPSLQEDMLYVPTSDLSPQNPQGPQGSHPNLLTLPKPRIIHVYSEVRVPPPPRLAPPRESPPPDLIRPGPRPIISLEGPLAGVIVAPQMPTPAGISSGVGGMSAAPSGVQGAPYEICRRPASVMGHLPSDNSRLPVNPRPHSSLSHYPRVPQYPVEEPLPSRTSFEGHPVLAQRGSYPGTLPYPNIERYPTPVTHPVHVAQVTHPVAGTQQHPVHQIAHPHPHPPPYGSHRTINPPVRPPPPQPSHQCMRTVGAEACSPVWAHPHSIYLPPAQIPPQVPPINTTQLPVTSHFSYTTPIVPETQSRLGPQNASILNGVSKIDVLRDERGVPEGASSSPRGHIDPQMYPQKGSPTREGGILQRHQPLTMNMS